MRPPCISQRLEHEAKGAQILSCLLDRNHVETGDDLGDAAEVEEISAG